MCRFWYRGICETELWRTESECELWMREWLGDSLAARDTLASEVYRLLLSPMSLRPFRRLVDPVVRCRLTAAG